MSSSEAIESELLDAVDSEPPQTRPVPRGFAELHRDVWRVFWRAPVFFVVVPAIVWFPADAALELMAREVGGDWLSRLRFEIKAAQALNAVLGTLVTSIFLAALIDLGAGRPISAWRAVKAGFAMWGRIVVVFLHVALRAGLATLLLILPGIYLLLRYALAAPVAAFEGRSGVAALEASAACMQGRYWRVALMVSAAGLIYLPLSWAPGIVAPGGASPWLIALAAVPANLVISFFTVGLALIYADARRDGTLVPPVARPGDGEEDLLPGLRLTSGRRGVVVAAAAAVVMAVGSTSLWGWLATVPIEAGDAAWEREAYEEALEHYRRAAYWDPQDGYVQYSIAWALFALDQDAEAQTHFARAVELEPDDPGYRLDHARVLIDLQRMDEAKAELSAARAKGHPDAETLEGLEARANGIPAVDGVQGDDQAN